MLTRALLTAALAIMSAAMLFPADRPTRPRARPGGR